MQAPAQKVDPLYVIVGSLMATICITCCILVLHSLSCKTVYLHKESFHVSMQQSPFHPHMFNYFQNFRSPHLSSTFPNCVVFAFHWI